MKRLIWDLEVSPNVGFFWRAGHKQFVNYESIIHERAIICACYKWEGEKTVHALTWDEHQSDKALLERFLEVAAEADELVAHNGDRFDMPWFKTRCLFHELQTLPDYKTVDTLQWAKRSFYFNSNRLDYLAKFLGFGGKIHTDLDLWKSVVLKNDKRALADMVRYCKRDVEILEKVYQRLEKMVPHKTHVAVLSGGERWQSPFTGKSNVVINRKKATALGTVHYQMQCKDTGRYYSIGEPAHSAYVAWRRDQAKKAA